MVAIQRHDRLARAGFHVISDTEAKRQQAIVKRPQPCFASRVHILDIPLCGLQVLFGVSVFASLAARALGYPPGIIRAQVVLLLEPLATILLGGGTRLVHQVDPFIESSASLLLEPGD